ncbi:MAG: NnrU family protein [Oceanococcaceae bacterium]
MFLLVVGLVLWTTVHLFPSRAPTARTTIISRIGFGPYKGLFALLITLSLVLIVLGWRATPPVSLWIPPVGLRHLTLLLMLVATVFFAAYLVPGNPIKVRLKHPQLMAVGTWGLAHLLANGEVRSILLFGTLLIWSFINIKTINARDGKPAHQMHAHPGRMLLLTIVLGVVLWGVLIAAHPYFAGRAVIAV